MLVVETTRLRLRHLAPQDLDALYALYRDPELRRYFPNGTLTLEETREELAWFEHGHPEFPELGLWATIERSTDAFIGRCGLLPWVIDGQREVELAFMIDKTRWGQGLATEAARAIVEHARTELQIRRLVCLIHPANLASQKVAQKVGMSFEREWREMGPCYIYDLQLE